ncbi:uncharacterized protein PODANS_4_7970 [Podospora anserina S mat+]|uniref:Podospora anserina S mat+ genomic DNA chromosome 4, supercontig 4 n=1 Tax=Podospora anserina (strain S / ATCC MYA-4624 / DSM 980 / FGSC 10383) TaxID=515849 RepID=B2ARC4_PODAN|nr:uncharacterized protein PODANS_4_7970 [Podospora anserina S mat+]CAP66702.1 unnamed protein product [Podospora anserina S mat+]CDP28437.1 Putative protein of unknown function [Podospora anserina S mat+]
MVPLSNPIWYILENYIYALPPPPPRIRTKPLEVICVGLPRSGTESLQHALLTLGYDHTYHGWDIIYEEPNYAQEWVKLCRKKWFGPPSGRTTFTPLDFDPLIGHSTALTDAAASVFAAELIQAYPSAKVILNHRPDEDAWHNSISTTIARGESLWHLWLMSWTSGPCFWSWHVYLRFMWPGLFRCLDGNVERGVKGNGRWVAREHYAMVRGLVPKERLLEWSVEDGWGRLCEFLDKEVPKEEFPHVNAAKGWVGHERRLARRYILGALRNLGVGVGVVVGLWYLCKVILGLRVMMAV